MNYQKKSDFNIRKSPLLLIVRKQQVNWLINIIRNFDSWNKNFDQLDQPTQSGYTRSHCICLSVLTTKKLYYCSEQKLPLKVYLTFSNGCYCGRFYLPLLQCHYRFIVAVTKSTTIDWSFSSAFGLLWLAKNYRHMRIPFESSDLLVAGNKHCYRAY